MDNDTCTSCENTTFKQGKISNGYAKLMPIDKFFSTGSALIYTFCSECGEVASIKVENPEKFN